MSTIEKVPVAEDRMNEWGISAYDYNLTLSGSTKRVDLQDMMVKIAKNRAVVVESEINPLSTKIQARNKKLDNLGEALAVLTGMQANFKSDDAGDTKKKGTFSAAAVEGMKCVGVFTDQSGQLKDKELTKSQVEEYIQKVKSKIDTFNNEAQSDMTRLQSLVDRRDQAYSAASELMEDISDTRSNLIGNIG